MDGDLDALPCGLLQTLEDGTIRRANRVFATWVGATPEALVGRRFQDLLTTGGRIFHHTHWSPLLRMQGSISEVKLELVSAGGPVPIVVSALRRDVAGAVVHELAVYVARDRDRYEKELLQSRQRLEQLVTELNVAHAIAKDRAVFAEQMMAIVSHDLRGPLGAIDMGAELLAGAELSEPHRRVVARISRATRRATHLIEDLLDFTQARVGTGLTVTVAPIELHDVVADSLDELRLGHPERTLVHRRVGAGACLGDARRLAQVVANLVTNAITYGAADQPITVTTEVAGQARIAIHNHGLAIPPELQATMFVAMTRGTDGGHARSVGLGLFIVREIARAHRGTATVTSTPEAGTTLQVEWPPA